tara:strand:+ start:4643 stop:5545 length:903 start_codon:yes stop_codon:yes gene_type:complete
MATISGTFKTYDEVGAKLDVEDIIYDISPTETPFTSSIGTSTATQTLHQWQEFSLAAVATNAAVEGADAGTAAGEQTTMKTNHTQIFSKVVQASGTVEATEQYGRASELQFQIAAKGRECRRDIEHAFVGAGQAGTAGNATTARQLKSAQNQISSSTTSTAGSNRTFTEALMLGVLQSTFEEGGNVNQIQVTPSHATIVAGFAAASGRNRNFDTGSKIVNFVDVYVSPFGGEAAVVPNRFLNANTVLCLDTEYWSRAVLRPMQTITLAKTGDSEKRQMLTELTLVCESEKASGCVAALTA